VKFGGEPKLSRPNAPLYEREKLQGLLQPAIVLASLGVKHAPSSQQISVAGDQRVDPAPRASETRLHIASVNVRQA
jgi:hypothetical protein